MPGQSCDWEQSGSARFVQSPPFGLSGWKQYADLKYQLPGLQFQQATNVSGKIALEYVSAETYLSLYDILLPKENETLEVGDSLKVALFIYVVNAVGSNNLLSVFKLYTLPWFLQSGQLQEGSLLPDNYINARVCKSVYRIRLALNSFYVFTVFSILILSWCLFRLTQSLLYPYPSLSSFSDIDLPDKMVSET